MKRLTKKDYKFIQKHLESDLKTTFVDDDTWERRVNLKNMIEKLKILRKQHVREVHEGNKSTISH